MDDQRLDLWIPTLQRMREGVLSAELGTAVLAMGEMSDLMARSPIPSPRDGLDRIAERLAVLQARVRCGDPPWKLLCAGVQLAAVAIQFTATFGTADSGTTTIGDGVPG